LNELSPERIEEQGSGVRSRWSQLHHYPNRQNTICSTCNTAKCR